jgi:hypothetical protein
MDPPPAPGTLDLAALALRLRHRRGRLSHALPVLRLNLRGGVHSVSRIPRVTF